VRREVRIGLAVALTGLAAGAALAFSSATEAPAEAATALVRFDRFGGLLGPGLEADQRLVDGSGLTEAVASKLEIDPETVLRATRLSIDPSVGIVAINATRPTAGAARTLAETYTRGFVEVSRQRLLERALERRRDVRVLIARNGRPRLSTSRGRLLGEQERQLADFIAKVRARRNPTVAQEAQVRAGPTSRTALLSGLVAAIGGLLLAAGVTRIAGWDSPAVTPDGVS